MEIIELLDSRAAINNKQVLKVFKQQSDTVYKSNFLKNHAALCVVKAFAINSLFITLVSVSSAERQACLLEILDVFRLI